MVHESNSKILESSDDDPIYEYDEHPVSGLLEEE